MAESAGPAYPGWVPTWRLTARAALALGGLVLLPACAEGVLLASWVCTSLGTVTLLWLGRRLLALDWGEERRAVLEEAARRLALPPPPHGHAELRGLSPHGLALRAHATPHLELRLALPRWVPPGLVVDTVAPPIRGLRRLVPDPRFLEWVAAGDAAQLLGLLTPEVRDALLEAHHFGPGLGICIRRGELEAAVPWADLSELEVMVGRMERIALALAALPESLPERLRVAVMSQDQLEVRQACLRTLEERFPGDPATQAALRYADDEALLRPRALGATRTELRGRLALADVSGGAVSVVDEG